VDGAAEDLVHHQRPQQDQSDDDNDDAVAALGRQFFAFLPAFPALAREDQAVFHGAPSTNNNEVNTKHNQHIPGQ
jgi:hypothetical protein